MVLKGDNTQNTGLLSRRQYKQSPSRVFLFLSRYKAELSIFEIYNTTVAGCLVLISKKGNFFKESNGFRSLSKVASQKHASGPAHPDPAN